jgi:hypothetical protein
MDDKPVYVYEGVEVIKTGKKAAKELASKKIDTLYEITPSDRMVGSWKKWVRDSDLYVVEQ